MRHCRFICGLLVMMIMTLAGCAGTSGGSREDQNRGNTVKYASHLVITDTSGITKLEVINPWQDASGIHLEYYLVGREDTVPSWLDREKVVFVPVERVVLMSTTYIKMVTALGSQKAIKGISGTAYVYDAEVQKMISEGVVADVGYEENLNREMLFKIMPDVVIAYGVGSESAGFLNRLGDAGIRIIYNADYLEEHPLAKAEWIKMFGSLFCLAGKADSLFSIIESEYYSLADFIKSHKTHTPSVLLGLPWQNAWYVSPGNSYVSNLIRDAGGRYIWEEVRADHAVPMGLENVFVKAAGADYWLNAGNAASLRQVEAMDKRLAVLNPFITGKVFNNNKRLSPLGGNDYWESGALNPQVILKDIASILHPGMFAGYEPYYYNRLTD